MNSNFWNNIYQKKIDNELSWYESLDGERNILSVHVIVKPDFNFNNYAELKETIRKIATRCGIYHTTVELEKSESPTPECDL